MTEAQMQALFDKIEGLRQQLSTFSDIVLMEIQAAKRARLAEPLPFKIAR